jgi:ribosomal protein S18 acetylase RimI-like enzyme
MKIVEAELTDLVQFFTYLENQLAENGKEQSPLFQPVPRNQKTVSEQTRLKFQNGFDINFDNLNWRKLWLAKDPLGNILGHIDLRRHNEEYCFHRALLGMGVDNSCRKQGIGKKLITTVVDFCYENNKIDWIDLNVLSINIPAKNLYLKFGFNIIGEMSDYYRIEGESVSEITMTKSVTQYE